jgi:hypothetical protein
MKIKYTIEEFENSKSTDKLNLECYYCGNNFSKMKKVIVNVLKSKKNHIRFCNEKCANNFKINKKEYRCFECEEKMERRISEVRGNIFCSNSCSAKYNNKHKKTGTRRSKLEIYIEEKLKEKYNFEIIFNGKEEIKSELDIYIPSLKLAFELNGIFHYEPIYGDDKLQNIKNNDERKFQACLERGIEFCVIDTSQSKKFKPERDKKYLEIIENIINSKLTNSI